MPILDSKDNKWIRIQSWPPPLDLRWEIDETGVRDGVDPKLSSNSCNPNMDLEPDQELTSSKKLTSLWYSYGDKNARW